jgi:hypothetical protein
MGNDKDNWMGPEGYILLFGFAILAAFIGFEMALIPFVFYFILRVTLGLWVTVTITAIAIILCILFGWPAAVIAGVLAMFVIASVRDPQTVLNVIEDRDDKANGRPPKVR